MDLADYDFLVYPNLHVLTKVYSQYIKRRLQANMELILFYPLISVKVRSILKNANVDLEGYE